MKRLLILLVGITSGYICAGHKEQDYNRLIRTDVGRNLSLEQMVKKTQDTVNQIPFLLNEERKQALSTFFSHCNAIMTRHEITRKITQELRGIINLSDLSESEKSFALNLIKEKYLNKRIEKELNQQQDNINRIVSESNNQRKQKMIGTIIANLSWVMENNTSSEIYQRITAMINNSTMPIEEKTKLFNTLATKRKQLMAIEARFLNIEAKNRAHKLHEENKEKIKTFQEQHGAALIRDAKISLNDLTVMVKKLLTDKPEMSVAQLLRAVEQLLEI